MKNYKKTFLYCAAFSVVFAVSATAAVPLPPPDGITTCNSSDPDASSSYYELITGKYFASIGTESPNECDSVTPDLTPNCDPYSGCPSNSDYTKFLEFKNTSAKGSRGGLVYVAITGK